MEMEAPFDGLLVFVKSSFNLLQSLSYNNEIYSEIADPIQSRHPSEGPLSLRGKRFRSSSSTKLGRELDTSQSRHGQVICQLFEMKRFFLFIGNLAFIVENFSTLAGLWRAAALQNS